MHRRRRRDGQAERDKKLEDERRQDLQRKIKDAQRREKQKEEEAKRREQNARVRQMFMCLNDNLRQHEFIDIVMV